MHDNIYLAKNYMVSTDTNATQCNNNILVIGGSGCGKTRSILEPRLLSTYYDNLIVTLSKRGLVKKYTALFKERGYKVLNLDLVKPETENANCSFDPICYVKTPSDILNLSKALILSDPKKKEHTSADPYWDESSVNLIASYIGYVMLTKSSPSFKDVLDIHNGMEIIEGSNGSIETEFGEKINRLYSKMGNNDLVKFTRNCYRTFGMVGPKTARCTHSTASALLASMFTPEIIKMMETRKTVNFDMFGDKDKKTILFISSSAVAPHSFINIFYDQMFRSLIEIAEQNENLSLPRPTALLADDFAVGSPMPNFQNTISIIREYNLSVMLLIQSESQLSGIYQQNAATTILNNCDTLIYLGGNDLASARDISERADLPLEDVLYMNIGKEIVFRRGARPKIVERYDVRENFIYRQKIMENLKKER